MRFSMDAGIEIFSRVKPRRRGLFFYNRVIMAIVVAMLAACTGRAVPMVANAAMVVGFRLSEQCIADEGARVTS